MLGFQAFDQAYAYESNQILFSEEYETIRKAKNIDEVLLVVRKYSSFSYQILEQLILNLGTENDKEELLKYFKNMLSVDCTSAHLNLDLIPVKPKFSLPWIKHIEILR